MKRVLIVAAICAIAAPVFAGPQALPVQQVRGVHFIDYNLATGEVTATPTQTRIGDSIWAATTSSGYFWGSMDAGANGLGWLALDWGDITDASRVGGYAFAYATGVTDHTIDCVNIFYADDNGFNTGTRTGLAGFIVTGLPGGDPNVPPPSYAGWLVTIDLESQGYSFDITGSDLDGDGLTDFSYTYWFPNCMGTVTGPFISGDPNVPGQGAGMEDAFDAFEPVDPNDPNTDFAYVASYWFGGDPFAQFYMELFGEANGGGGGCPNPGASGYYCDADIDGSADCIVDLADLAVLLSNYGTTSGATHDQGDLEGGDGDVDFADLAALLGQYGDDCN